MQKITPFLWFEKGGKEAADFYVSVFGEENAAITSRSLTEGTPSGTVDIITLQLFGRDFMFMTAGPFRPFTEAVSFMVSTETQEETDRYWNALSAVPEAEQCGWLKDKYGVSWQIIPTALDRLMSDSDKQKAGRVLQAMLKMKKIVIADLESAYAG